MEPRMPVTYTATCPFTGKTTTKRTMRGLTHAVALEPQTLPADKRYMYGEGGERSMVGIVSWHDNAETAAKQLHAHLHNKHISHWNVRGQVVEVTRIDGQPSELEKLRALARAIIDAQDALSARMRTASEPTAMELHKLMVEFANTAHKALAVTP